MIIRQPLDTRTGSTKIAHDQVPASRAGTQKMRNKEKCKVLKDRQLIYESDKEDE